MKRQRWLWVVSLSVLSFLISAQSLHADIQNPVWESPVDGASVSGILPFRGHVSSTTGAQVTVRLLIPAFSVSLQLPWGSDRNDVAQSGPDRLSGFGDALNVAGLPSGAVTMTLELREGGGSGACNAPTCVQITRNFTVVKPGARAGELLPFSFLSGFAQFAALPDPNSGTVTPANVALDQSTFNVLGGPDIIVAPVTVEDSASGTLRTATARLRWVANTQSFGIVASATSDSSFSAVQGIFGQKCGVTGCHVGGGTQLPGSMILNSASNSFFNTVAKPSVENANMLRITPNNTGNSYLYQKIIENGNIAAGTARMPLGCSGATCLSPAEIATIENWINAGAPPPAP
jgi:hypothetical protein